MINHNIFEKIMSKATPPLYLLEYGSVDHLLRQYRTHYDVTHYPSRFILTTVYGLYYTREEIEKAISEIRKDISCMYIGIRVVTGSGRLKDFEVEEYMYDYEEKYQRILVNGTDYEYKKIES